MKIEVQFEGLSFSIKVKRIENEYFVLTLPSFIKSKIPFEKLKEGEEVSISLASILKGAGTLLEKFK